MIDKDNKSSRTARVIVTFNCNRKCPGCCNNQRKDYSIINSPESLFQYKEIVITGGEPLLNPTETLGFINYMREHGYKGKIFMYTSYWSGKNIAKSVLRELEGITYTIHAEANDSDIMALKNLSNSGFLQDNDFSSRLFIDKRLYEKYDFSNINLTRWNVIRKLEWKEDCHPAEYEDLIVFLISKYDWSERK